MRIVCRALLPEDPFDQWDYDGVNENILVDMEVDGVKRKTLVNIRPQRFAYEMEPRGRHPAPGAQVSSP